MNTISILIGGKAGDGIDTTGFIVAHIFSRLGYRVYVYRDYPSIIRGGHTFSIIRVSQHAIAAHEEAIDFLLALNQETFDLHHHRLKEDALIIYNSEAVKLDTSIRHKSIGLPFEKIIKEEGAPAIMRNSCMIGLFAKALNIPWEVIEGTFKKNVSREFELNMKVASRGYREIEPLRSLETLSQPIFPLLSGNEAIGLGLIKGGLKAYIGYPMTPVSGVLHFLAGLAQKFSLYVIHPENEISVMMMAMGFAYMGERVAVGSSGGGFCLMTEGLSFSGMSELPVVIVLGQRTGPSTGLPTYTAQTELTFAMASGQGEFPRFIVAPSDAEDAYYWSAMALEFSWKYQIPAFILADKTVCEGMYSFDKDSIASILEEKLLLWDRKTPYQRYADTKEGVSPLAFAPTKDAVIKVNSYEHDASGITTEDAQSTKKMQEKRLRKEEYLYEELTHYVTVTVSGNNDASSALLCWGSNKGVCSEVAERLRLRMIHVAVLSPFPLQQFKEALAGVEKILCVENNASGQLARLISSYGIGVDEKILKYDGRPFTIDELYGRIKAIIS
ncbi:MAG: 2-oxoacid:acceptor oxidoreductase subunit alpha [Candidatus Omnitrophica bacterium]|nr:2-oxoacid:acceptor oxidoreductase subunit alpha [Candidatus Omnitrophota bacterium]